MVAKLTQWLRRNFRNSKAFRTPYVTAPDNRKFENRAPDAQNEIDIFTDRWASDLSDVVAGTRSGAVSHFKGDPRPGFAMNALVGDRAGRALRVLELGPLEAGHTYQFEKLGVDEVIAVEANVEAFLKCLIVKNLAGLQKSRFLFGDVVEYLRRDKSRYDFIFCCGVLYHMRDPVELIELMAPRTDRIFVWTHYYTEASRFDLTDATVVRGGETYVYHCLDYADRNTGTFWGGNKPTASLLSRDDILRAFRQYGFVNTQLHEEDLRHPGGPCFSISFWR